MVNQVHTEIFVVFSELSNTLKLNSATSNKKKKKNEQKAKERARILMQCKALKRCCIALVKGKEQTARKEGMTISKYLTKQCVNKRN